jgi:hypothetical protein
MFELVFKNRKWIQFPLIGFGFLLFLKNKGGLANIQHFSRPLCSFPSWPLLRHDQVHLVPQGIKGIQLIGFHVLQGLGPPGGGDHVERILAGREGL